MKNQAICRIIIIVFDFQQVPTQLWSPRERETLKNIVEIMMACHLTYIQNRSPEGAYTFQLEP